MNFMLCLMIDYIGWLFIIKYIVDRFEMGRKNKKEKNSWFGYL